MTSFAPRRVNSSDIYGDQELDMFKQEIALDDNQGILTLNYVAVFENLSA